MSKYVSWEGIQFADLGCLLAALQAFGIEASQIEQGDLKLNVYWESYGQTSEDVQIAVRREALGQAIGGYVLDDLGFKRTEKGYVPVFGIHDGAALARKVGQTDFGVALRTEYSKAVAREIARRLRGSMTQRQEGGALKLVVRY